MCLLPKHYIPPDNFIPQERVVLPCLHAAHRQCIIAAQWRTLCGVIRQVVLAVQHTEIPSNEVTKVIYNMWHRSSCLGSHCNICGVRFGSPFQGCSWETVSQKPSKHEFVESLSQKLSEYEFQHISQCCAWPVTERFHDELTSIGDDGLKNEYSRSIEEEEIDDEDDNDDDDNNDDNDDDDDDNKDEEEED